MTCTEIHQLLHHHLDGNPIPDRGELDQHLAQCSTCRELFAAAQRLEDYLRTLTPPAPPADLSQRIVACWFDERRALARWRRPLLTRVAAAAVLLLAVYLGYSEWRSKKQLETRGTEDTARHAFAPPDGAGQGARIVDSPIRPFAPEPSLHQSVEEAGSALVALVNRTTDETIGQGKILLPNGVEAPALPPPDAWQQTFEPPVESLREARQNVALGLEPVTDSARRAVNLFLRAMPQ